jgi:hypothetical protein
MLVVMTASDVIQTILAVIALGSLVVSIVSLRHSNSAKAESAEATLAAKRSADAAEGSRDELRRANDWVEHQESEDKARATRRALRVDHLGGNRYVLVNSGEGTIEGVTLHVAAVPSSDLPNSIPLAAGQRHPFSIATSSAPAPLSFRASWEGQETPVEITYRRASGPKRIY